MAETMIDYLNNMTDIARMTFSDIEGLVEPSDDSEEFMLEEYKQNAYMTETSNAEARTGIDYDTLMSAFADHFHTL